MNFAVDVILEWDWTPLTNVEPAQFLTVKPARTMLETLQCPTPIIARSAKTRTKNQIPMEPCVLNVLFPAVPDVARLMSAKSVTPLTSKVQ